MKKLIIMLIILKSISLNAQYVIVGFKGGPSIFSHRTYIGSNFYESTDYGNEIGIILGVSGKHLAFQVEPSSLILNLNYQENINNNKFETRVKYQTLNIPFFVRIKAGKEFRIFADVGLNYNVMLQFEKEIVGTPVSSYTTKDIAFSKNYKNQIGGVFGIGVERDIKESLFLSLGVRKQESALNYGEGNFNITSNTFIAYFGVCLRFSKQKNK
jgi:hypothetical protein